MINRQRKYTFYLAYPPSKPSVHQNVTFMELMLKRRLVIIAHPRVLVVSSSTLLLDIKGLPACLKFKMMTTMAIYSSVYNDIKTVSNNSYTQ